MTLLRETQPAPVSTGPNIIGLEPRVSREDDPYGWALQQAALLRAGRLGELDRANLADAVAGLARHEYDKLVSAVDQILRCLLKWDQLADARDRNWPLTIHQQRRRVVRQMRKQRGLMSVVGDVMREAYGVARAAVSAELALYDDALPSACPYTWNDVMDRDIAWLDR